MDKFIVLDTETTWDNRLMSIGAVIVDAVTYKQLDTKYYILTPEYMAGGMYSHALSIKGIQEPLVCSREKAIKNLIENFALHNVNSIFAYNASFDYAHLPELARFNWHDIMRIAAYAQYNLKIPSGLQLCSTGRLKSGYGVEPMLRMLSGDNTYCETHNALLDAMDELKIMMLLGYPLEKYFKL